MSERGVTSHDEPVNQEGRQPALDKGGPEVILSVIDDATSISDVQPDLRAHPGDPRSGPSRPSAGASPLIGTGPRRSGGR